MHDQTWLDLRHWYSEPLGKQFGEAEAAALGDLLATLSGQRLLVLGVPECAQGLASDSFHQHWRLTCFPPIAGCSSDLVADPDALPIASRCVDVAVLCHVLECVADPYAVLREVERVLLPDGYVLTLGFNPFSPVGVWRSLGLRAAPRVGRLVNMPRLQDWLARLDLESLCARYCFYWPWASPPPVRERQPLVQRLGPKWWPILGGAYVVMAKKRSIPLTMIKQHRPVRPYPVPTGLIRPVAKAKRD
ncbi:MAG: methyltransferase domain-containing protein [Gammaproteobacteria bacterium]|nr:methyltransferase domain-containing protein [Gammaproteobacteria bacterium]MCP5425407.1 methyltransferase domain-containing protein [Gammaproteobacteria bacterium]MCP5459265.1 methyltransferase domain-containing protein [Gammaproteobacteria bacterium]